MICRSSKNRSRPSSVRCFGRLPSYNHKRKAVKHHRLKARRSPQKRSSKNSCFLPTARSRPVLKRHSRHYPSSPPCRKNTWQPCKPIDMQSSLHLLHRQTLDPKLARMSHRMSTSATRFGNLCEGTCKSSYSAWQTLNKACSPVTKEKRTVTKIRRPGKFSSRLGGRGMRFGLL